jgi:hypothetical protein
MLLFRNEYLDRPVAQIDRYRVGGSQSLVYGLGAAGARYLKEELGTSIGKTDWRSRNRTYTRENLDHTLAVSRFLIDLELACRETPGLSFIPFEDILARAPEATRKARNPMPWPVSLDWRGGRTRVNLVPDAIFGLRMERKGGKAVRSHYFLEMDRGTMTIAPSKAFQESDGFPYRATILRKFHAYANSYRDALHERYFGVRFPRTLFCTSNSSRAEVMEAASVPVIEAKNVPRGVFVFGTHHQLIDSLLAS